jgi:hypothetical protein
MSTLYLAAAALYALSTLSSVALTRMRHPGYGPAIILCHAASAALLAYAAERSK